MPIITGDRSANQQHFKGPEIGRAPRLGRKGRCPSSCCRSDMRISVGMRNDAVNKDDLVLGFRDGVYDDQREQSSQMEGGR